MLEDLCGQVITTRYHGLFDQKTRPKINHFDIWSYLTIEFEHIQLD